MAVSNSTVALSLSALCLALAACGSGEDDSSGYGAASAVSGGTGGMPAAGSSVAGSSGLVGSDGTVGAGGTVGSGGIVGAGGTVSAGGIVGSGGAVGSGGTVGTGGIVGSGGVAAVGGQPAGTGGIVGTGGVGTGGIVSTGGTATTGPGSGGLTGGGTGGITASAGTGGTDSSTGGASAAGGADAAAGASAGDGGRVETGGGEVRARQIETRGFTFDALETASDGEPVLLLHGFPDTSLMWSRLMPELSGNGYHCLAPDQRGYSPGARPTEVDAYRYEELIADAFAFGSELGDRFHLVAHDWGANVGWLMLATDPSRIASFTAISIPHYQVWARSVYEDEDMAGYLRLLNIWMTEGDGEAFWTPDAMRNMWTAKPADQTEETIAHMMEPGAMTAALNWYRASNGHRSVIEDFDVWEVNVPTLLIFGSEDMGQSTVADTAPLMTGSYHVVQPEGGHFIVDEQPQVVAEEILAHLRANPILQ